MAINRNITYLNKDFNEFRASLLNFSQNYFPDAYSNFSNTSVGTMFIEQAAYVGDVLSFYLDNQVQETFLQYARQNNNVYELAYMMGYKPKTTGLASVDIDFYQLVPAIQPADETIPDYNYALFVNSNTEISTANGQSFIIEDSIDFTFSSSQDPTEISIAEIAGGEPTRFLLKKTRKATSGTITSTTFSFGSYQEFPTVTIEDSNIAEIIDIVDSDGNTWYEVDYLGQELVFDSIKNTNTNDPNNYLNSGEVPYILKTKQTQRRFATRFLSPTTLQIQFGSGNPSDTDEDIIPNPDNVGLGLPFEKTKLTTAYSPTNFIFTNTYGIAPTNTTLTVRYLKGGGVSSNISSNTLSNPSINEVRFLKNNLDSIVAQEIFNSFASNNPLPATGGRDGDTISEVRQNALSSFGTQLRAVTSQDYLIRALSIPSRYGAIAKAHIQKPLAKDKDSVLDLYILTKNQNGYLTTGSSTLKNNLKTYLNQYRIVGDTIGIKDAFIINIGCNFEIITYPDFNSNEVLSQCISSLQVYFNVNNWQINQPIILRDIYSRLELIPGVQSIGTLDIINIAGTSSGYSQYAYDIKGATQKDIIYPSIDPSIFELKYLSQDIKGKVVTL